MRRGRANLIGVFHGPCADQPTPTSFDGEALCSPPASDEQVRALLDHYKCPHAFHEVRMRFLGNIASPVISASPLEVVKGLCGDLPPFDTIDDLNGLLGALVIGLWNRLSRHQDRSSHFRLTLGAT